MLRSLIGRFAREPKPGAAAALMEDALAARAQGDLDRAAELLARAASRAPDDAAVRCLLADVQLGRGDEAAAEALAREAVRIAPADAGAARARAPRAHRRGAVLEAAHALARSVELEPARLSARVELGSALTALGRPFEAVPLLRWVLKRDPGLAVAQRHCGAALQEMNRLDEALPHFERAVALEPQRAEPLNGLAMCLRALERHEEAIAALERAVALAPDDPAGPVNLATVLRELGRAQPALAAVAPLVARRPDDVQARCVLAAVLQDLGDHAGARAQYDAALAIAPGSGLARLGRALLRLAHGEYAGGWDDYEGRMDSPESPRRGFPYAEWAGAGFAGRTVLVYAEQGLGDEIMFAGCLPDLIAEARRVVVECDPRLARLFERSFPDATVQGAPRDGARAWLDGMGPIDVQAAAGSLPRRYRRDPAAFPAHRGYLRADPARVAHYRACLAALGGGPGIGLAWRGGLKRTRQAQRSLAPDELLPLLERRDLALVSLQHDAGPAELERLQALRGAPIAHWPEAASDPDEAAALMSALDATVTVCGSVVHLGGALGMPVVALVPAAPEWRYRLAGERMPWYPSVTLVRQSRPGDWGEAVREALRRIPRPRRCAP